MLTHDAAVLDIWD